MKVMEIAFEINEIHVHVNRKKALKIGVFSKERYYQLYIKNNMLSLTSTNNITA